MNLRLDMQHAVKRAPILLGEAAGSVLDFLLGQFNSDGGVRGRGDESDLYYTVFALDAMVALGAQIPSATRSYVDAFAGGERLDLVHCACLARSYAALQGEGERVDGADALLARIAAHRSDDGGFGAKPGLPVGTVYHTFLGVWAYGDLGVLLPNEEGVCRCVAGCAAEAGGYANERGFSQGTTPTTAAAGILLNAFGRMVPDSLSAWLLARCVPEGGFRAIPDAPIPDLLSTATAIHALAVLGVSLDPIREPCLDYLDSLWTGQSFRGHWADDEEDVEYTYYGLLALGHLGSST